MSENALSLVQRAKNSIALGESHFREFKTALEGKPGNKKPRRPASICNEIAEAIVAFTNADGGELFIGVEDDGTITGLMHKQEDINMMLNAVKTHILEPTGLPLQFCQVIKIDDKQILFFCVTKSTEKIFQLSDGRCMRRQDKSSMPANFERIQFERREAKSREFDRVFVDGASVNDLDSMMIQQIADSFLRGMSPEQYLQQVNVAEYGIGGLRIKRAALLLFAKDISKWFPRCQIRILKVRGNQVLTGENYNVISDDYITGNVFELLSTGWERLRPFLSQKTVFSGEARFEQTFVYPENACREALVNAIAHRDYSINNPVTIYVFDDKLVFESPGELLSTISLIDLQNGTGVHESRNSNIARVLRENKYMRELGEGVRRIFELMKADELAPPVIESDQGSFRISLNHSSIYTERELLWLSLFDSFELNQYQKRIVIAGMDGRKLSPDMIYAAIGSNDRNLYDRNVTTLRIRGVLKEINTSMSASKIAKETGKRKQEIPRFEVVTPDKIKNYEAVTNKIYLFNLPEAVDEEVIVKELSIFGAVKSVKLPRDEHSGLPQGFAFVEYTESASALKAVATKNIKIKDGMAGILTYKPYSTRRKYTRGISKS